MIPTREELTGLNGALSNSIDSLRQRVTLLSFPQECGDLTNPTAANEIERIVKHDVTLYIEQSELIQRMSAWQWLHAQHTFLKAKERCFKNWPSEERRDNGMEKQMARYAIRFYSRRMQERERLISVGAQYDAGSHELALVNRDPSDIFDSAIRLSARWAVRYRIWVAGVGVALSNYHYGATKRHALDRKGKAESLLSAWEHFSEQISVAQSDPDLREYLGPTVRRLSEDFRLALLNNLHQSGALYFIARSDDTVSERLFIRELAVLHHELFSRALHTSAILDMFYLEGMNHAPTERAVQRIARTAIRKLNERQKVETDFFAARRQKTE